MAFSSTWMLLVARPLRRTARRATRRRSCRFSIAGPSIFAKLDLPDPKKPETQTAIPSCGLFGVSRYSSKMS